jgi:hypothetical protein
MKGYSARNNKHAFFVEKKEKWTAGYSVREGPHQVSLAPISRIKISNLTGRQKENGRGGSCRV